MPTISRRLVNPVATPLIALAARARVNPCSAACSSPVLDSTMLPSVCLASTPGGRGTLSLPLGPSTCNCSPILTLTPFGSGMGLFPTRDIEFLPDLAEHFSTKAFLVRRAPGHHSPRRRQNIDPEASLDARDVVVSHIDT